MRVRAGLAAMLLLAGCDRASGARASGGAAPGTAPVPATPAVAMSAWTGTWTRTAPAAATLTITPAPSGLLTVAIDGAGAPRGAGSAADCSLRAEGRPQGDRLDAPVVPGRAGDLAVSAVDVQAHGWRANLVRGTDGAIVVRAVYDACGVGADLSGTYVRGEGQAAAPPVVSSAAVPSGPRSMITDHALGGVSLGASPAEVRARFGGDQLRIADDGAFTRFDIVGASVSVGFDGEGRELKDGSDSLSQAGRTFAWDALKPSLKTTFLETTSPDLVTGDGVKVGQPLAYAVERLGPATVRRERTGGVNIEWATFATDGGSGIVYGVSAPGGGSAGVYPSRPTAARVRPDAVIARIRVRASLP